MSNWQRQPGTPLASVTVRIQAFMRAAGVRFDSHESVIAQGLSQTLKHSLASAPVPGTAGAFVHHQSLQPHGMTARAEPMLALWRWAG